MAKKTTVPVSSTFDKELFKRSVLYNVRTLYRKTMEEATDQQIFQAVSYAVKDQIVENWMETQKEYEKKRSEDSLLSVHGILNGPCTW